MQHLYNSRMLVLSRIVVCSLLVVPLVVAHAQPLDQQLENLRTEILNKHLIVQGLSADPVTKFNWTDAGLKLTAPKLHTFAVLVPNSVKLSGSVLSVTGRSYTGLKGNDSKIELIGTSDKTIQVDLGSFDPATVLPNLKSQLFYPTLQAAMAAIPPNYAEMLPSKARPEPTRKPQTQHVFGCPVSGAKYKHPEVLSQEEAHLSDEAIRERINGAVWLVFTVDESGKPTDVWLARPAGHGLDENAVSALSKYRFKPGACDGAPLAVPIQMVISFQVF